MAADPKLAMAEAIREALGKHPGNTVVTGEPGCAVVQGVFNLEDVADAAWQLALFWLDNLDAKGSALVEVIEFLEDARREILPG